MVSLLKIQQYFEPVKGSAFFSKKMSTDWMSELEGAQIMSGLFEDSEIVFPGTHNSAVTKLKLNYNAYEWKSKWFWLPRVPFLRPKLRELTITQSASITDQLQMGVRFFDLRVGMCHNVPYIFHTFCSTRLRDVVCEFKNFLVDSRYKNSVIIIYMKPDFESAPYALKSYADEQCILSYFDTISRFIVDEVKGISLTNLVKWDRRVIFKYEYKFTPSDYRQTLYNGAPLNINTNWGNTGDIDQLNTFNQNILRALDKNAPIYGLSFTLNLPTTVAGLLKADLKSMANRMNTELVPSTIDTIAAQHLQGKINVISVDFATADVVGRIIGLNRPRAKNPLNVTIKT